MRRIDNIHIARAMACIRASFVCALVSFVLVACSHIGGGGDVDEPAFYTEQVIYRGLLPIEGRVLDSIAPVVENDGEVDYREGVAYLSSWCVTGVLTSNEAVWRDYSPWRLPTRREAVVLHDVAVADACDARYLCVDEDGTLYSFCYGSGKVTKAGTKTKYSIRPIRVEYTDTNIVIYL